jgi:hypothetical protein
MNANIKASAIAVATAMTLIACVSKGAVNSTGLEPVGPAAQDELAAEYQSLIDNVMAQTVCREQAVTGSRIHRREVCLTRAQRVDERERTLELLDDAHKDR